MVAVRQPGQARTAWHYLSGVICIISYDVEDQGIGIVLGGKYRRVTVVWPPTVTLVPGRLGVELAA